MNSVKIKGSDKCCVIYGEGFSYTFVNGHPVRIIRNLKPCREIPYPLTGSGTVKSKAKLVHKYRDSAMVITRYKCGSEKKEAVYRILPSGECEITERKL